MDACFGLARRKGRGDTSISSRHGTLLFSDQDDVDNFVDNYEHVKKQAPQVTNMPVYLDFLQVAGKKLQLALCGSNLPTLL